MFQLFVFGVPVKSGKYSLVGDRQVESAWHRHYLWFHQRKPGAVSAFVETTGVMRKNRQRWKMSSWWCLGSTPDPVTVTTRVTTFLVGNACKPSFATGKTSTGCGVDPNDVCCRLLSFKITLIVDVFLLKFQWWWIRWSTKQGKGVEKSSRYGRRCSLEKNGDTSDIGFLFFAQNVWLGELEAVFWSGFRLESRSSFLVGSPGQLRLSHPPWWDWRSFRTLGNCQELLR